MIEDPVGKPAQASLEAIAHFHRVGLERLDPSARLDGTFRAPHNGCGAVPFRVDLDWGGQPCSIEVIDVMEFDATGRIRSMKAYRGETNMIVRPTA